jgi:hypothetical protein
MGKACNTYKEIRNSYPVVAAKSRRGRKYVRSTRWRENTVLCLPGDTYSCSYYLCDVELSLHDYKIMKWKWIGWKHVLI